MQMLLAIRDGRMMSRKLQVILEIQRPVYLSQPSGGCQYCALVIDGSDIVSVYTPEVAEVD